MSKSSLLIIMVCLSLLLGAAQWWYGSNAGGALPTPLIDTHANIEPASTRGVVAADASVGGESEWADGHGSGAERTEVLLESNESRRVVIQVWDRKKGVVAAEADVFILEGYRGPELSDPFGPHMCELAETKGKRFKASTKGRVEVSVLEDRSIIAARLPGASAVTVIRRDRGDFIEVVLRTDETVTVRVIDERGHPVSGVPVGIKQRIPDRINAAQVMKDQKELNKRIADGQKYIRENPERRAWMDGRLKGWQSRLERMQGTVRLVEKAAAMAKANKRRGDSGRAKGQSDPLVKTRMELQAQRRTNSAGVAVFRHFQLYRHRTEKWWPQKHRDRFEAVLMMPLSEPVDAPFSGNPVSDEVIELRMPATGSLALTTVDRDGRPFTHPVRGELRIVDGHNPSWSRVPIRKLQNEREIVFPFVGLGLLLQSQCRLDDNSFKWQSPVIAGPTRSGERVTVDLVVAPDAAMLYGRLMDADGVAIGGVETTFLINSNQGRLEGEEIVADEDGRFHLPYESRESHKPPFRLQVRYPEFEPAMAVGLARTLGVLPNEGVTDLGDLQIGELDPIASGRVVNDLGEAIVGARVQLQRERAITGRGGPRLSWEDEAFTVVETDEGGHFGLFGDIEAGRYRLRVTADEHFAYEQPNLPRGEDVLIKLLRRSRVVGTVLSPSWMRSKTIRLRLESHTNPKDSRDSQIRDAWGAKHIYFDWVRPGIYSLALRVEQFPDAFLRVENFEVKAGQKDAHPRLKHLEIGSNLHRFEVFAVDEAGKPMTPKSPLLARTMRPDGRFSLVGFSWRNGRAEVYGPQASLEVIPESPGFRAEPVVLVAGRSEIRFLRIPPVTLHAPGMQQLVGGERVWISLEPLGGKRLEQFDSSSRRLGRSRQRQLSSFSQLGKDDTVQLKVMRDGRYRVAARLGSRFRGGTLKVPLGEVSVLVVPGGPPIILTVTVDAQAMRQALKDVAARKAAAAQRRPRKY